MGPFSNYAAVPIAVPNPPVDITSLQRFVERHVDEEKRSGGRRRLALFFARKPEGLASDRRRRGQKVPDEVPSAQFMWDRDFAVAFRDFVAWFACLPFSELWGVDLVTQAADVHDHLDIFGHHNSISYFARFGAVEPIYYRMILGAAGDSLVRTNSFYVTRTYGGRRHYIRLPRSTSTIAMSSSICYHGAKYHPGHFKTTGVVYGRLDWRRHAELLERSAKLYARYAIRFRAAGPVAGPGAVIPYRSSEHR